MTQLEIEEIKLIDTKRKGLYKVRISIGGYMFFDSPELPKATAEGVEKNLIDRTKPKSGMYG